MDKLEQIITEMTKLFKDSIPLEKDKLKAASNKQVTFVEECMKKEQALLLKIRGLEQKRVDITKELGYENKTFKEIIQMQPEQNKEKLNKLFEEFSKAIEEFHSINQEALKIIKLNMHDIDKAIYLNTKDESSNKYTTDQRV